LARDFVKNTRNNIKDDFKDIEFEYLFDKIDIVRDGSVSVIELKFFLKKLEWNHNCKKVNQMRQKFAKIRSDKEKSWLEHYHPKLAESKLNINNYTSLVDKGEIQL
jgi:hypothetical protein